MRGSSAIFGDVDSFIELDRKSNEHHLEPVLEMKYEIVPGFLRLECVPVFRGLEQAGLLQLLARLRDCCFIGELADLEA